ncbi:MAG: hypothetical protein R3A47_11115 [Polyangiales bacterium]
MAETLETPSILLDAWDAYGSRDAIVKTDEVSADVSTNQVYRMQFESRHDVISKISGYGSYVHFRQDHYRIHEWIHRLRGTRYASFLAKVLLKDDTVFTYRDGDRWVVFYEKTEFYDFLPPKLTDEDIDSLGREVGLFHRACAEVTDRVRPTWQTVGSDVATLYDVLGNKEWRREHHFGDRAQDFLRAHCDAFLHNSDALGYHEWLKIPILIDWNIGNFSVGYDHTGFKFFSRWDYDWFRIEPRMLDFYFCARVVREEGDQNTFSYRPDPLLEPRFIRFLRAYHEVHRLTRDEVLFLKEAYRFFILNYVIRVGEHFFRPEICERLQTEAIDEYLPALEPVDLEPLCEALGL